MPHPRRRFINGEVYFCTNRLAQGLPFVPNRFICRLVEGIIARAQCRNPDVVVCSFDLLQNHYHSIIMLKGDPAALSEFFHDLHDELARLICKLLGKKNIKVWAQRFHAAKLGDSSAVFGKLAYAMVNPVAAGFCETAAQWWGIGTWTFLTTRNPKACKWTPTRKLFKLPNSKFTKTDIAKYLDYISNVKGTTYSLKIEPFAWKQCFPDTSLMTDEKIFQLILDRIEHLEKQFAHNRQTSGSHKSNKRLISHQNPYKKYRPTKYGVRTYCICSSVELREELIAHYRDFCEKCRHVWHAWKNGDWSLKMPPGAFIPSTKPSASILDFST